MIRIIFPSATMAQTIIQGIKIQPGIQTVESNQQPLHQATEMKAKLRH